MLNGYRAWLWLLLLCAALYLPGMAPLPALDRDESRFMQASRQMVKSGDLIAIRFHDQARNKKPVGIYWLQSASVVVLSKSESTERWPYRVPSVLGATAAVLLMFLLAQLFVRRSTAFLVAALLASCTLVLAEAHIAKTDAMLLATVLLAQFGLARAYVAAREEKPPDWMTPACFWGGLAFGALIKGPICPLTVGLTLVGLKIVEPRTALWPHLRPLIGVPVALAIVAPWYVAIILSDSTFLQESAGRDLFAKIFSAQEQHGFPPGFYLAAMTLTFAPASLFAWTALFWSFRRRREPAIRFALLWLVPYWLLLEATPTKLLHYVLPLYPALALLVGIAVEAAESGLVRLARHWVTRLYFLVWWALLVAISLLLFWAPIALEDTVVWPLAVTVLTAVLGGAVCVRLAWQSEIRRALLLAACAAPLYFAPVLHWGLPALDTIWPSRTAAKLTAETGATGRTLIGSAGYTEPSFVFYHGAKTVYAGPKQLAARVASAADWRAYVVEVHRPAFLAALRAAGIPFRQLGVVTGHNYSRGQDVRLTLYGPAKTR